MFITKIKRSPYYYIVYNKNGKRTCASTKTKNITEAYQFLKQFSAEQNKQNIPQKSRQNIHQKSQQKTFTESKESLSLIQFQNEYVGYSEKSKSVKYVDSIKYSLTKFIAFAGDVPIDSLTVKTVDAFINTTFAGAPRMAHLFYRTLKAAFNKAIEWEYIDTNPFTKFKFPKLTQQRPAFIVEEELKLIVANTPQIHLQDIFTIAFYTGMRLSEIVNMKWNWIDLKMKTIVVKNSKSFQTKNKTERIIPMSEQVYHIIARRFNNAQNHNDSFVLYRIEGEKLFPTSISKQFKTIVRKLNIDDRIHFHSLRHSFASALVSKGVSLYTVKELLGHSDIKTTQIYSHLQTKDLFNAINKLE